MLTFVPQSIFMLMLNDIMKSVVAPYVRMFLLTSV